MEETGDDQIIKSISLLPQDCVSKIISFTTPKDAIRALAVSSGFKAASGTDTTWERFLPSNYQHIVSMSETPLNYSTKRELFFLLCNSPIFLDGGTKCFWLSKSSGKKCYMLCASELSFSKKKYSRIWRWPSVPKSRFQQVAELLTIGMLRIKCNIQTEILSPKTKYAAYLVFGTTQNSYGFDSEFKGSVRFVPESCSSNIVNNNYGYDIWSVYLTTPKQGISNDERNGTPRKKELDLSFYPKKRMDGWKEIFLGEFFNNNNNNNNNNELKNGEIEIQLYEKRKGVLKSGLVIEGIEIRPSLLDSS